MAGLIPEGKAKGEGRRVGPPTQKERKVRAFRLYLDLLDTGNYMRHELKGQMAAFGLTTGAFRFLEILYSEGAVATNVIGKRLRTARQNVDRLVRSLEARGWVEKEIGELPPVNLDEKQLAKHKRGLARHGRRIGVVRLTPAGEKFVGEVLPRHMKLVLALMRTLNWREQQTLGRVCRKLREGDAYRLLRELEWEDAE